MTATTPETSLAPAGADRRPSVTPHRGAVTGDISGALLGPLPAGWRERKGLPPSFSAIPSPGRPANRPTGGAGMTPPRVPGAPQSPWRLGRDGWRAVGKRVIHEFGADRVTSVAGGVTFFGLLALFPAITALVSIYGLMADPSTISGDLQMLDRVLPESMIELIGGQVTAIASASGAALSVAGIAAILVALWSANGGMKALIEAMNIAWSETEKRGFIRLNLLSLAMTLGAILGIIAMLALIAVLPILLDTVLAGSRGESVARLLRWPLLLALLIGGLAVLYRFGPSRQGAAWQWISPGALLATAGLLLASVLFSFYVSNLAHYNRTYGALGAAVVTMMWLWIAAIMVLAGAELDAEVERQLRIDSHPPPEGDEAWRQN